MVLVVLITAVFSFAIGGAVVWANPRRLANRSYATVAILCGFWCTTVYVGIQLDADGDSTTAAAWFLADNLLAAFFPWANWRLKESLLPSANESRTFWRPTAWLAMCTLLACLCFLPSFITPVRGPDGALGRGTPYFIYTVAQLTLQSIIILQAVRHLRLLQGIRRLEMQCLILNVGLTCFVAGALNGIGSYLHSATIKLLGFPIILVALGIMAWAMAVHRVFEMRHVFLSMLQRAGTIAVATVTVLLGANLLGPWLNRPAALITSLAIGLVIGISLDRNSRTWLGLDGRKRLRRMRQVAIDISRTEASTANLIAAFEALLRAECRTEFISLNGSVGEGRPRLAFGPNDPGYSRLCEDGWATPESLQRRRTEPDRAALQQFLARHDLGLILAVPRGSPMPSLVVIFGTKTNRGPFTYPEIEQLISLAELMDNILARSRLTTQAALQAKTEHLALMSRGLAHDLKNLITPISSFLVHTDQQYSAGSAEAEVHDAAKRSVRIINDYISEALFFANRMTPRFERVNVPALLESVREVTAYRAEWRSIRVQFDGATEVHLVADAVLLQRLIANLVTNAIDASPARSTVAVSLRPHAPGAVRIQVVDHGCGIPEANVSRVFDPYFTTKEFGDDVRGFGLGLTICQKIVALHAGTLSLQSEVNVGTTVTVDLPADGTRHPSTGPVAVPRAGELRPVVHRPPEAETVPLGDA